MLLMILWAAATPASPKLEACIRAVHGDAREAVMACSVSKESVNLFAAPTQDERCGAALAAGERYGRTGGGLPAPMKNGLIADFDRKVAQCTAPDTAKPTATRPLTNLWD